MTLQLTPSEDLSLQHVLENGLAVLRNEALGPDRRVQALNSLSRIFSEAEAGSQALNPQNLLFGVEQRPALERFTLFFQYLDRYFGESLSERLQEAFGVFANLRNGQIPDSASHVRTQELIERLLAEFDEERSRLPLEPPRFLTA